MAGPGLLKKDFPACRGWRTGFIKQSMSEMEEDKILEEAGEELHDLEEKPKSFLVLVAVILGALSLILSFIALKQGGGADLEARLAALENPPIGEAAQIDGAVGAADIHSQLQELKQELANLKTSPAGLNAGLSEGLGQEVAALKAQMAALKAQATNLRPSAPAPAPSPPSAAPATPVPAAGLTHTIVKGETLSGLSKKYGVSLGKIRAANQGLDENRIQVGQKINIPGN